MTDVSVTQNVSTIAVSTGETIEVITPDIHVTGTAEQGPEGIQGEPGPSGATTVTGTAGAILSGHRIVTYDASGNLVYASSADTSALSVFGLLLNAAALGDDVTVQTYGKVTEPSWTWTPLEPLYLSTNGTLTQTAPTTGYLVRLGYAVSATSIMLAVEPALRLA